MKTRGTAARIGRACFQGLSAASPTKGFLFLIDITVKATRVGIEHLISSIKSVVKLKPLRVWAEGSVRGSLLLAMISQLMISMVRQDLEPELIEKKEDGKMIIAEHRPSNKAICESLVHWTVTVIPGDGFGTERIFSNESELSGRIHEILKQY